MHPYRFKPHVGIWTLALMVSAQLQAQDMSSQTGLYMGLGTGQSTARIDQVRIRQHLLTSDLNTLSLTEDRRGQAYKGFVGFPIHPNWAVEAGYFDLGRFGYNASTTPTGKLSGTARMRGLNLDLVGTLPITERWSLMGRVGAAYAQTKDRFSGTGAVSVTNTNPSQRDTHFKYGVGAQFAFTPALSVGLEAERYRVNDAVGSKGDVDMVSLGLIYRFGGPAEPAKAAEKSYAAFAEPVQPIRLPAQTLPPAPVTAPLPAPLPAPAAPVTAPAPWVKVTLEADTLFGFDLDSLQSDGQHVMDELMLALQRVRTESIHITGHTDRLGSTAYNNKLSLRRAQAVKNHLVEKGLIAADTIRVHGAGSSQPATQSQDCPGTQATRALITCLRTDRRVEVLVNGMQAPR